MKRNISLALICVFTLSSLLFSSCRKVDTTGDGQGSSSVTTVTTSTTEAPAKPVPVDSVNGMSAKQLMEKFLNDYTNSKSFDLAMTMTSVVDGTTTTERMETKLNDKDVYVYTTMDGGYMKVWCVDGVVYVDMNGEKYKANTGIEDIFGDGFIDELLSSMPTAFPEEYMEKVKKAQIYSHGGEYYFSVTFTAAEAEQMGEGDEEYTETIYFDSTGKVKRMFAKTKDTSMTLIVNSYGKAVSITKPADADKYVVKGNAGSQDPEVYAVYEQLLDTIANAEIYQMIIAMNEAPYIYYETDGNNKYAGVYEEGQWMEMWSVDGQGYVAVGEEYPVKTSVTEEMLSSFSQVESLKMYIVNSKFNGDAMTDLELTNVTYDKLLSFTVEISTDYKYHYTFTFDEQMLDISVYVLTVEGTSCESVSYYFGSINEEDFEVVAPI